GGDDATVGNVSVAVGFGGVVTVVAGLADVAEVAAVRDPDRCDSTTIADAVATATIKARTTTDARGLERLGGRLGEGRYQSPGGGIGGVVGGGNDGGSYAGRSLRITADSCVMVSSLSLNSHAQC
ncbi:MAG: hypothetical protein ACXVI2_01980, partial [Ilumatobacteraceae bacterium]